MIKSLTLAARGVDEDQPRDLPPPHTTLQFPCCSPPGQPTTLTEQGDVLELFANMSRTGPQAKHLQRFGIVSTHDSQLDDLVSVEFLPEASWINDPALQEGLDFTTTPPLPQVLSSGREAPSHFTFYQLARELMFENGDAFRSARRQPMTIGRAPLQIIHSRKFWLGLADMSEYWDTTLDHYSDNFDEKGDVAMDIDELRSEHLDKEVDHSSSSQPAAGQKEAPKTKETYTGRRKDTGSKMPNRFREDTVASFVEMILWNFDCTIQTPITSPKIHLRNLNFHLPHSKSVHRIPKDYRKARVGVREGPLMGIYCREHTEFRKPNERQGEGKVEVKDLLLESALMATLAQKRAKEGQKPSDPYAEKWWASTPRWGGGPGGAFGFSQTKPIDEGSAPAIDPAAAPQSQKTRAKKMSTEEERWRNIRPPSSTWEQGITYQHVGKDKESPYDDVST